MRSICICDVRWLMVQALSATVLLAGGCSTESYKGEVGEFSTAMNGMAATFGEYQDKEREAFIGEQVSSRVRNQQGFRISETCQTGNAQMIAGECGLYTAGAGGTGKKPIQTNFVAPNAVKLTLAIQAYAQSLLSLTDADTVADLNERFEGFAAALDDLGQNVSERAPTLKSAANLVDPITATVQWFGLNYLKYKRFAALLGGRECGSGNISNGD